MSNSLSSLVRKVRHSTSPGGTRIYLGEAQALLTHAKRNGGLSAAEQDVLETVLEEGDCTPAAQTLLAQTLDLAPPSSGSSSEPPDSLELNRDGAPLLNGRTSNAAWTHLASVLADDFRTPGSPSLKATPLAAKKRLLQRATTVLNSSRSRDTKVRRQLRSSAFTVTFALAASLPRATGTRQIRKAAHKALFKAANRETHPRLARHMIRLLTDRAFAKKLTRPEKAAAKDLFVTWHPQAYDVGHILDEDGYIQWEHSCGAGENMYRSFLVNILTTRIGGARFEVQNRSEDSADLEVTFKRPRGENQRVKGIRLHVKIFNNDLFDSLEQPVGISYGGHSNTGNYQEKSLDRALKKDIKATEPRFVYLDLCAGLDGLDDALEHLGDVEILTTLGSSLYTSGELKDEEGVFSGVDSSEMQPTLFAIWEGLSREEDYKKMRRRVKKEVDAESHSHHPNYIFGTLKDYREVRWAHLDGDDDGVADALDIHYQFGLKNPTRSISFNLVHRDTPSRLNGDTVRDAVLDLNVSTHYHELTEDNPEATHKFISGGFFDGKGTSDLVRFSPTRNTDGKPVIQVQVNSGLAGTSREALGALVHYAAMLELLDSDTIPNHQSELDRKLHALVFACARLTCDGGGPASDKRIWTRLLKTLHLPGSLPYSPLAQQLLKEEEYYTGSRSIVREYKQHISAAAKTALRAPNTGRIPNGVA